MKNRLAKALVALPVLLIIGVMTLPTLAQNQATDVVAKVVKLQEAAVALQDALPRALAVGDEVLLGDVISTGAGARLEIELLDGSIFKLGERTHFVVLEFIMEQNNSFMTSQVLQGAFQAISGQIAALDGDMTVVTPSATIGIRGTTVWGGILDQDYEVALIEGTAVDVSTRISQVTLTEVGDGTRIASPESAPTAPVSWAPEKIARAVATITFDE